MLSKKIHLLSGPGCPVCVTPSSYIDKLIELSMISGNVVATFGDLIRVPGSKKSLSDAKGEGAEVLMLYSPLDLLKIAKENPDRNYIFAAVGFETTTPVYAVLLDRLVSEEIENVKLLTSLKTMPEVIEYLLKNGAPIDGFIAPGHVCAVTGYDIFSPIARKYDIPFGVSGFKGEELLIAIYGVVKNANKGVVKNYYPSVVKEFPEEETKRLTEKYFKKCDAAWRGMGNITDSGMMLRDGFSSFDAGSKDLTGDEKKNRACICDQVLMGKKKPFDCPLYKKICSPLSPQGACMVSTEGSCFSYFSNDRRD